MSRQGVRLKICWGNEVTKCEERIPAKPLESDLYQLLYASRLFPHLNRGDVVRAVATGEDSNDPLFQEVVRPSGQRTVRYIFAKGSFEHKMEEVNSGLQAQGVAVEPGSQRMYVASVDSVAEYERVHEYLEPWVWSGRVKIGVALTVAEWLRELESF